MLFLYIGMIILSITALEAVMDRSVGKMASELDIKLDIEPASVRIIS